MEQMKPKYTVAELIERAGGITSLARQLGITHNSIYSWEVVPPFRVAAVAKITGVSMADIRPDMFVAAGDTQAH
jgi:DNA-binding transcriptional regulator YdaS (Cro superfamily)